MYRRVYRCKIEQDSSDSALETGYEQVPAVTSHVIDIEQQLLYDLVR